MNGDLVAFFLVAVCCLPPIVEATVLTGAFIRWVKT